jgi:histidinol-phosphate phosphatase family protein
VINRPAAPGEYIRSWDEFRFLPNIVDWIRLFNALGLLVIVVTNQRGVARGLMTEDALNDIHRCMEAELAKLGGRIDDIFCCVHDENKCDCRKPHPGLILKAAEKWNIDLEGSLLIGDSESDREAARRSGVAFVLVANGQIQRMDSLTPVAIPG